MPGAARRRSRRGSFGSLVEQRPYSNQPATLGLFFRTFVLDDGMYDYLMTVPAWLAPWSLTRGWVGFAREELELDIWLNFYFQDGHAYIAPPGKEIRPLVDPAPPFTLRQTTDLPDPGEGPGPQFLATRPI